MSDADSDARARPAPDGYYSAVFVDDPPTDLFFRQVAGAPPAPEDLRQLKLDLEAATRVVLAFFRDQLPNKRTFMERLRLAAQVGCCSQHYSIVDGRDSLDSTKKQVVDEGYRERNKIWHVYTRYTLLILIPCAVIGLGVYVGSINNFHLPPPVPKDGFPSVVTALILGH